MNNETLLEDFDVEKLDAPHDHDHTMGYGKCTKCGCKGYDPPNTGGKCQASDGNGGTCGHKYDDHNDS